MGCGTHHFICASVAGVEALIWENKRFAAFFVLTTAASLSYFEEVNDAERLSPFMYPLARGLTAEIIHGGCPLAVCGAGIVNCAFS